MTHFHFHSTKTQKAGNGYFGQLIWRENCYKPLCYVLVSTYIYATLMDYIQTLSE